MKKLSIIIPVYNEARTIAEVIRVVSELQLTGGLEKEIIVVDDCSTDTSKAEIQQAIASFAGEIRLCAHAENKGKGGAIQTGIGAVTGDYVIIQDADLELVPAEINRLVQVVLDGRADIVYGSRFLNKEIRGGSWLSNRANAFLTTLSNRVFGIRITDMETCYKLVPADVFKSLRLVEQRFGFEPEITAKLARHKNLRWAEVAITYNPRTNEQGKKIGWRDGFRAVWCILKYGFGKG